MHGLINYGLQKFFQAVHGEDVWSRIVARGHLPRDGFEPMLSYDDRLTDAMLAAAETELGERREGFLEDFGTFLVAHPLCRPVRRLLRFGGESYEDFLHSVEELGDRARLALPDLDLPQLVLEEAGAGRYAVRCRWCRPGFVPAIVGILRALADDYGALVLVETDKEARDAREGKIAVTLLDGTFASGRAFSLGVMREGSEAETG